MKIKQTITLNKETRDQAREVFESKGQKFSPVIELYLKKIIEENKEVNHSSSTATEE